MVPVNTEVNTSTGICVHIYIYTYLVRFLDVDRFKDTQRHGRSSSRYEDPVLRLHAL